MIDARKGVLTQTKRHSFIVGLLAIKNIVLVINKMDLVDYDQVIFDRIDQDYRTFASDLGFDEIVTIPMSALAGDNILENSNNTPWYSGKTLMAHLETVEITSGQVDKPFRFPVQWVNRPNHDFRGYSGTIASGSVTVGDEIVTLPNAKISKVETILGVRGEKQRAEAGEAITLCLADEIDVSRGDVIAKTAARPESTDQFQGHIIWMHEEHMLPGRPYLIKTINKTTDGVITELKHKVNVNSLGHESAKTLALNEVGLVNINLDQAIIFDAL